MKPVGKALLMVCLSSVVVGGVVLAAPEISPAWSVGGLALLTAALLATHGRPSSTLVKSSVRERVVFQKMVRVKDTFDRGLPPARSRGQHEILLRIVDA